MPFLDNMKARSLLLPLSMMLYPCTVATSDYLPAIPICFLGLIGKHRLIVMMARLPAFPSVSTYNSAYQYPLEGAYPEGPRSE